MELSFLRSVILSWKKKNVHCIIEDGNCLVSCEAVEEKETLLCTYDTITTGFVLLQANYPDNVKFIEK